MRVLLPRPGYTQAPFITTPIPAGHPAENYGHVEWMSLDAYVAEDRAGDVIYVQVEGDSMRDRDIEHGDVLIVRLCPVADSGDPVLVRLGESFTVKNFYELETGADYRRRLYLVPSNPDYNLRSVSETDDFEIVGVVEFTLKRTRGRKT